MRRASEAASSDPVRIALVGKYVKLEDAYLSVAEALRHAGFQHGCPIEIDWVDSETLDDGEVRERVAQADGILIPGGFGVRGIEGKITASRIAREQKIPFLGICLGMQMAVADFARHVVGMDGANSTEFDPETPCPGHRPPARAEGGRRHGRHDAPGRRPDQAARRTPRRASCTARPSSTSATAIATRSTTSCASGSRPPGW